MICAVAMDPRFKFFASKLCTSVSGDNAQERMVWANVKDMAIQHWKFEEEEQGNADEAIMSSPPQACTNRDGFVDVHVY